MKLFLCAFIASYVAFTANCVFAFQHAKEVQVTNCQVDHSRNICTITISNQHHVTTRTQNCRKGTFSWQCFPDDYRYELARQSQQKGTKINIRYSEYSCERVTNNMLLLTAW